jgi:hypothetical protein
LRRLDPRKPHSVWPRLGVVSCWGDAQAALPLADLKERLPHAVFQSKGLLATEAFVSIPFDGRHPLAIASHFFEFESTRGDIHTVSGLNQGDTYSVLVTTGGGLYRYRLGDLVEVDGFVGATPSLRFLGRGERTSDLCGEKLAEAFVTRAIEVACASCEFVPRFAMLAPATDASGRWHYTLFVEGNAPPELVARLDDEFHKNPHYALCRNLGQLGPLDCFQIAGGGYETYCETSTAAGRRLGDIKPQALSTRTDWHERFRDAIVTSQSRG